VLVVACPILIQFHSKSLSAQAVSGKNQAAPSSPCAACHAKIVETYSGTPMAKASGAAGHGFIAGEFQQPRSGILYRVYEEGGQIWLSFSSPHDPEVRGKRRLQYYIGSGRRGRTYLFTVDQYLFESPVNWYGQKQVWDMTPAYHDAREAPLNLPTEASCLHCHTTGMAAPAPGTENRYPSPPFEHAGVTCARCHGDATAHLQGGGRILNPAKLPPGRRDDICMQCHLEGDVAIEQHSKEVYDFRPGDRLSDYVRYFVKANATGQGLRAASQFEALWQSACKRKTGDAMTCTSCHDPHATPSAEERTEYYRAKCLACHGEKFATKHHPREKDCVGCHMPRIASSDVAHTQATDHRILRRPEVRLEDAESNQRIQLVEFPPRKQDVPPLRDLALAWELLAKQGMSDARREADELLPKAVAQHPDDAALLSAYAYQEQGRGETAQAQALYERSLQADPNQSDAETNLAVIEANKGNVDRALELWKDAFQRQPWQSAIGMDLAITYCQAGRFDEARMATLRVLEFNPDFGAGKAMLKHLNSNRPAGCR
jgi:predicted CXXCH cytochrome family protein